jgi:hypothetical protein
MIPVNSISTLAALLSLAFVAGCASAPDASAPGDYAAMMEQAERDPNRMVCRRQKETGSRLSSRVCKTAGEWEQERLDNQDAMRNATKSPQPPSSLPSAGGG